MAPPKSRRGGRRPGAGRRPKIVEDLDMENGEESKKRGGTSKNRGGTGRGTRGRGSRN